MRNLLTPAFKSKIRQEYALRLVAFSLFMFSLTMIAGFCSLLPAYVLSQSHVVALTQEHQFLQSSVATLTSDTSAAPLASLKQRLEVLSKEKEEERLTEVLLSVLSRREGGVALHSLGYTKTGTKGALKVTGVAQSRETLLAFKRSLESDARFGIVDLPVSNLAREKDILFDITLSGGF